METDTDPLEGSGTAGKCKVFPSQHKMHRANQLTQFTSGEERSRVADWARPSWRRAPQSRGTLLNREKEDSSGRSGIGMSIRRGKRMRRQRTLEKQQGKESEDGIRQEALFDTETFDLARETLPSCNTRKRDSEPGSRYRGYSVPERTFWEQQRLEALRDPGIKPRFLEETADPWRGRQRGKAFSDKPHYKVPGVFNSYDKFYENPERVNADFKTQDSFRHCESSWLQPEVPLNKPSFSHQTAEAFSKQADIRNPAELFRRELSQDVLGGPTFESLLRNTPHTKELVNPTPAYRDKWGRGNSTAVNECLNRDGIACFPEVNSVNNYLPKEGANPQSSPARKQAEVLLKEFKQFLDKRAIAEQKLVQAGKNPEAEIPLASPLPMIEVNQPMDCSIGLIDRTN